MITVEEALTLIDKHAITSSKSEQIHLTNGLGRVLSNSVSSPINMPPFRQSAMDGYALHLKEGNTYSLQGEIQAGADLHPNLQEGEAVRIFTGAAVPDTANAVVMQEVVTQESEMITVDKEVSLNENIRPLGEQIKSGEQALPEGHLLNAASIGFLSSLGVEKVNVTSTPSIALIITGNELAQPGTPLQYGQVYESNSQMLIACLKSYGFDKISTFRLPDNETQTNELLATTLEEYDFVISSGGISVGDYDFVGGAMKYAGVEQVFYKVLQKPGKPLYFGKKDQSFIFALPGNPAAAMTCLLIYVLPVLRKWSNHPSPHLPIKRKALEHDFTAHPKRAVFLKAIVSDTGVQILEGQQSSMLHTFALANALVYLPADSKPLKKGDLVNTNLL